MKGKMRRGFTLVELIVVIAIIGILAAILVPSIMEYVRKANRKADTTSAKRIGEMVELVFAEDMSSYQSFYWPTGSKADHNVTVGGDSYKFRVVCKMDGNKHAKSSCSGKYFTPGQTEYKPFVDELNRHLDSITGGTKDYVIPMRSVIYEGKTTDRWLIGHRLVSGKNGSVEVWAGDSWGQWGNGPSYRLWPSPSPGY